MTTLQLIGLLDNTLLMSYSQLTQSIHFKHDFMSVNALSNLLTYVFWPALLK